MVNQQKLNLPTKLKESGLKKLIFRGATVLGLLLVLVVWRSRHQLPTSFPPIVSNIYKTQPLMMKGGDPYIRALMRTISASEANSRNPYAIIYGGEYVSDLSRHPNRCVPIVVGPNTNQCTTAAGRYQFLNTTWDEKAKLYHPQPANFLFWRSYSFEPQYQDQVVYAWLSDKQAWGVDISKLLQQGKVKQVLKRLSGTWTSLGYGIETNSMSKHLPAIYQQNLREELKN